MRPKRCKVIDALMLECWSIAWDVMGVKWAQELVVAIGFLYRAWVEEMPKLEVNGRDDIYGSWQTSPFENCMFRWAR